MKKSRLYLYISFFFPIFSATTYETSAFIGFRGGALKCMTTLAVMLGLSWQASTQANTASCSKQGTHVKSYGDHFFMASQGREGKCQDNSFLSTFDENLLETSVSIKPLNESEGCRPRVLSDDGHGNYVLGLNVYSIVPGDPPYFVLLKGRLDNMTDVAFSLALDNLFFYEGNDGTLGPNGSIVLGGHTILYHPSIIQINNDGSPGFTTIILFEGGSGEVVSIDTIPESQGGGFELFGHIKDGVLGKPQDEGKNFLLRLNEMGNMIDIPFVFGNKGSQADAVKVDSEGNTIYLAYIDDEGTEEGGSVIGKRAPNRTRLWEKSIVGEETIDFYILALDAQDNIYLTGFVEHPHNSTVEIALDKDGNVIHPATALGVNQTQIEHAPFDMTIVNNSYGVIVGIYYNYSLGFDNALISILELDNFRTCYSYNITVNITDIETLEQLVNATTIYTQIVSSPVDINVTSFNHYFEELCELIERIAPTKTPSQTPSFFPSTSPTQRPSASPTEGPTHAPLFTQTIAETMPPKKSEDESSENFYEALSTLEKGLFLGGIILVTSIIVGLVLTWSYKKQCKKHLLYIRTSS